MIELLALFLLQKAAAAGGGGTPPSPDGPAGDPANFTARQDRDYSPDSTVTLHAVHYKNGLESGASNAVVASYEAGNVHMLCTWYNGDPSAYTRVYSASGVLQAWTNPGVTFVTLRDIILG